MTSTNIKQREIWLLNLSPTISGEITKVRPCVVVSDDSIGILPLKTIVPLTNWQDRYSGFLWMSKIEPNTQNGLSKPSAADSFQIRNVSELRFIKKLGTVTKEQLKLIHHKIIKTLNLEY